MRPVIDANLRRSSAAALFEFLPCQDSPRLNHASSFFELTFSYNNLQPLRSIVLLVLF